MTFHAIIVAIRTICQKRGPFPTKKNDYSNGYSTPLVTESNSRYGRKKHGLGVWFERVKKKVLAFPLLKGKGSFLCRAEQRKIMVRRTIKAMAAVAVILVVIVGLKRPVQELAASIDFFRIREVSVSGCTITRPSEIKAMTGIDFNTNMFAVAPGKVAVVVGSDPWIKSVRVVRNWPNRIKIEVEEYKVRALLAVGAKDGDVLYSINGEGQAIAPLRPGQDMDYPVITGIDLLPGDGREKAMEDALLFLQLVAGNDPNLPLQSVSEIHFDASKGMIVYLVDSPFPIYFGDGEIKRKYKQLRKVLAALYKGQKGNVNIGQVEYIRMDYDEDKVLVAQHDQVEHKG